MAIPKIPAPLYEVPKPPAWPTLSGGERVTASALAVNLFKIGDWTNKQEGDAFWMAVYSRVRQLAEGGPLKGPGVRKISPPVLVSGPPKTKIFGLTKLEQDKARDALASMSKMGVWYGSPEGGYYWEGVAAHLQARVDDRFVSPKKHVLCAEQKTACGKASALLLQAFDWDETAEGGDFWNAVDNRLLQMSVDGEC